MPVKADLLGAHDFVLVRCSNPIIIIGKIGRIVKYFSYFFRRFFERFCNFLKDFEIFFILFSLFSKCLVRFFLEFFK